MITILKLATGQELIADVTKTDETLTMLEQELIVRRPMAFGNIGNDKEGKPQIGFMSYIISDPECEKFRLNGKTLTGYINEIDMYDDLKKEYMTKTSRIQIL